MQGQKPLLKVSVFSDYICPFCYIGSCRLLRLNEDYDLRVNWCGLEIHPDTPAEGMAVEGLGYSAEEWAAKLAALRKLAAEDGLQFLDRNYTTNSRRALLLAEAAKQAGRDVFYSLHLKLFRAYFEEGRNIGDAEMLTMLAREAGLSDAQVEAAWRDSQYARRLQSNLRAAVQLGVQSVPTFAFDQETLVGAVSYDDLQAAAGRAMS